MSVVAVIQARFGSSRLPGKVLEDVGGRPMLEKVIQRVFRATSVDDVIVATTDSVTDDSVSAVARGVGATVHRGSTLDVLDRFKTAIGLYDDADLVVRVTADCPFVDPGLIDDAVAKLRSTDADFVANRLPPPFARTYPVGLDVEVTTAAAIRCAWREATEPHQREHVMPYLYDPPGRFRVSILDLAEDLSNFRWTVDTRADLLAVRALAEVVGPEPFSWRDVLAQARKCPAIGRLNAREVQKGLRVTDERW
ncbi:glycosyltransferase family protein [Pengzhenrongella sp.]|uniref:glycosyltransferase family protein n=1 Tax=Pengzhenrongella sp. TaxID=2888820 RepID=UPI002F9369D4